MPIIVSTPASTANLGAGFDCLALALGLRNVIELEEWDVGLAITAEGEGADRVPRDARHLVVQAAEKVFALTGRRPAGLRLHTRSAIPLGSGMGSSAATAVGGLAAANALVSGGLTPHDLLRLAFEMEGHPDNAAAAIYGGLTLVGGAVENVQVQALVAPAWQVVIALPAFHLPTAQSRAALPAQVTLKDAVFNIGHALFTVQAFATADADLLAWAVADRLHQPYRRKLVPGYDDVEQAALAAGARAVALSGAGPSLIAFATDHHIEIAAAMRAAFAAHNLSTRTFILPLSAEGVRVEV